jgi:uncharacterized protein (TIGR01627 family)
LNLERDPQGQVAQDLQSINLIIFPDWQRLETHLYSELASLILTIFNHPEKAQIVLFIDTSNIEKEEAELALSSIALNLMVQEGLEIDEEPEIVLLDRLDETQWSELFPQLDYRISLTCENQDAAIQALSLPAIKLARLSEIQFQIENTPSVASYRERIIELVQNNPYQLSVEEYAYITDIIAQRVPGNFLIFGVGKDSSLWIDINQNGRTVFLENNLDWLNQVKASCPQIEVYLVNYETQLVQWIDLLLQYNQGIDRLSLDLPEFITRTKWDFIFVDAPAGYSETTPGRMKSIYTAAKLAFKNSCTDVFVHDCDRYVENLYAGYFLHEKNLKFHLKKTKHYKINFYEASNSGDVLEFLELGVRCFKLGQLQESESLLRRVLSFDRRNRLAMEYLARVLIELKKEEEAITILEHRLSIQSSTELEALLNSLTPSLNLQNQADRSNCPDKKTRRILVINNLYPPQELGGYGRRICDFANVLEKRGYTIQVLTSDAPYLGDLTGNEERIDRRLKLFGTYETLPPEAFVDRTEVLKIIEHNDRVIRQTLDTYNPEVCLLGNIDLLSYKAIEPILERAIPVVHLLGFDSPGYEPSDTPQSSLYYVAANSEFSRKGLIDKAYPLEEIGVIYPGAFTRQFQMCSLPHLDKLRIVFASLVLPYKGPQVLLEALAILHEEGIDFQCSVAGNAPVSWFLESLKEAIASDGFQDKVEFLGYLDRPQLIDLFATHNVLVFPSTWEEPFGRSQVEAMAAGLTLITSGTGGSIEIIEPGVSGLTFPAGDAEALAKTLMGLLEDLDCWQQIAANGQKRAELFDIDRSIDAIEDKFEELCERRKTENKK